VNGVVSLVVYGGLGALVATFITAIATLRTSRGSALKLLSEAQNLAQKTALDSAHEAFESVRAQCDRCNQRLEDAERRLARSEERMQMSERRVQESEERGRRFQAALRAVVRVMDDNDPTQVQAAIAAARELI
jgi:predicted  nucleic acid-binding Zn-ribbon protein